jgi:hypothetical protein
LNGSTTTPKWVKTGVPATPEEHELLVAATPHSAEDDSELFFELADKYAQTHNLPDINPNLYAYHEGEFVYNAGLIQQWLKTSLGHAVEAWLRRVANVTERTRFTQKKSLSFHWINNLKPRMEGLEDWNLIRHWWLYRDPRWMTWRDPEMKSTAIKARSRKPKLGR